MARLGCWGAICRYAAIAASNISPATYLLRGIRDALINGRSVSQEAGVIATETTAFLEQLMERRVVIE